LKVARRNCHPCSRAHEEGEDDEEEEEEVAVCAASGGEEEVTPKTWPKVKASQARKASKGLLVAGVPVTTCKATHTH
jgi:hypothetical protein